MRDKKMSKAKQTVLMDNYYPLELANKDIPAYVLKGYQESKKPKVHFVCPSSSFKAARMYNEWTFVNAYCGRWVVRNDSVSEYWHYDTVRPKQRKTQLELIEKYGTENEFCKDCLRKINLYVKENDFSWVENELAEYMEDFYKVWAPEDSQQEVMA